MPMLPKAIKLIELAQCEDWNCDKSIAINKAIIELEKASRYYKAHNDEEQKRQQRLNLNF